MALEPDDECVCGHMLMPFHYSDGRGFYFCTMKNCECVGFEDKYPSKPVSSNDEETESE